MMQTKVFGIGFHKTGTSTLKKALDILGYKVCGNQNWLAPYLKQGNYDQALELMYDYDACQDNPWPLLYKELDKRYPGSKFILTIRDSEAWYKSVLNHFGTNHTEMRKWIYNEGSPDNQKTRYIETYENHNKEVINYFRNRRDDLLIIRWDDNINWTRICDFLNQPVPQEPFPHANKGAYSPTTRFIQKIKLIIYKRILKPLGYGG